MKKILKTIVLRIIPRTVIRSVGKRLSLDYIFFGKAKRVGTYLIEEMAAAGNKDYNTDELNTEVKNGFDDCYSEYNKHPTFLRKYVLSVDDCIIEPKYGWAIKEPGNHLVIDSISNNTWIENYHPSYHKFTKGKLHALELQEAVSINIISGGEANYWHFLHDLLGQISMAITCLPFVSNFIISKELSQKRYFIEAVKNSSVLAGINWIIRNEQYIKVNKAWFLQVMPNSNDQFFNLLNLFEVKNVIQVKDRRIFLKRSSARIRFLENAYEIESIAKKYNFEIIDADELSFPDQIKLFSETRYLVGIHGAGLTNIIFRNKLPLTLLELFPRDYLQPHYFLLSKGFGYAYIPLVGTRYKINQSFQVNRAEFEQQINKLLKS